MKIAALSPVRSGKIAGLVVLLVYGSDSELQYCIHCTCIGWLVYSCCSHVEHKASLKHFGSLQFLNLRHSVELLGRVISPSQGRYLTQTQNKHRQPPMPLVGFEPMIQAFERVKTVHALDRAAIVFACTCIT
jgi:hypothetical protein